MNHNQPGVNVSNEIYTIANGKGGSGKTTTAYHLAKYLAAQGRPPLVWGLDDVGGLTRRLQPATPRPTGADVLAGRASVQATASAAGTIDGVLVVPESAELREINSDLTLSPTGIFQVAAALRRCAAWLGNRPVVLDTPGNLSTLTAAALVAGSRIIIPTTPAVDDLAAIEETRRAIGLIVANLQAAGVPADYPEIAARIVVRYRAGVAAHDDALSRLRKIAGAGALVGVVPLAEGRDAAEKIGAAYTAIFDQLLGGL